MGQVAEADPHVYIAAGPRRSHGVSVQGVLRQRATVYVVQVSQLHSGLAMVRHKVVGNGSKLTKESKETRLGVRILTPFI